MLSTLPAILTGIAALVTAVAGLIAVFAAGGDSPNPPTPTPVGTPVVATITATATPTPTATAEPTRTPEPGTTPVVRSGDDWPAGRSAYTVILASKTRRAEARAVADSVLGDLPDVGVLRSDEHAGLNPGYWVAYSGVFDERSRATRNAADARTIGHPSAYVRWVKGAPAE